MISHRSHCVHTEQATSIPHRRCGQDPQSGVKAQLLDDKVGQDAAKDDAEAAAENGAHCQPEPDVVVRIVFLHVDLGVVSPRVATCVEEILTYCKQGQLLLVS